MVPAKGEAQCSGLKQERHTRPYSKSPQSVLRDSCQTHPVRFENSSGELELAEQGVCLVLLMCSQDGELGPGPGGLCRRPVGVP